MYGTYEDECEAEPTPRQKVVILGSGPNRIGQGIEFDYCCCHAAFALREEGFETIMINCNPETVSTDYDTVDRLYFEPLTFEDVVVDHRARARSGRGRRVRRPVRRADAAEAGAVVAGSRHPHHRHLAGLDRSGGGPRTVRASCSGISASRRRRAARRRRRRRRARSPPRLVSRSSSGRRTCSAGARWRSCTTWRRSIATCCTPSPASPGHPILIDKFLEDAVELDVDAVADATGAVVIGGIMEHIEEAGIHSGDSSCVVPPYKVIDRHVALIRDYTRRIARALKVVGLMNAQFAIKEDTVYVLEVNPRASRTVPYLSKATGVPLAKVAARRDDRPDARAAWAHRRSRSLRLLRQDPGVPVRAVPGCRHDSRPGDEIDRRGHGRRVHVRQRVRQGAARGGREAAAGGHAPSSASTTTTSRRSCQIARDLSELGFKLLATRGTANYLRAHGLDVDIVFKVNEGRPHVGDEILNNTIQLVINTPLGRESFFDDRTVRRIAMMHSVPSHHDADGRRGRGQRDQGAPHRRAHRAGAAGIPRRSCTAKVLTRLRNLPAPG